MQTLPHYFLRPFFVVGYSLGGFLLLIKRYYSIVTSNKQIKNAVHATKLLKSLLGLPSFDGGKQIMRDMTWFLCGKRLGNSPDGLLKPSIRGISIAQI
ncbi:MAG: hypothetical protein Q7T96_02505 [Methylobacter sp.]|nr:hypothetical protein [Methylobacter sp.]